MSSSALTSALSAVSADSVFWRFNSRSRSTSNLFVAASTGTSSGSTFSRRVTYRTLPDSTHWIRSSTSNSNCAAVNETSSPPDPPLGTLSAPARSARVITSSKCWKYSTASCCRPVLNSGWFLPTSCLNIRGWTAAIWSSGDFLAYRSVTRPTAIFAIWVVKSSVGSFGEDAKICAAPVQYRVS